ncbi:DUF1080 domain-containing protein [Haloferula sp. BvORR071]|uniref:3-keto-disaccharide hydrolase n=1 Tax=Haloferula sp. BvORR071 TaxID=1396141 RepID=UPI000553D517|nr:DUF1080 domain-containing protein [Haloferula sp. BvORR071]
MRIIGGVAAAFLLSAGLAAAGTWEDLFNGSDLTGWEAQSKADWRVEGGAIVASKGQDGLLTTRATYRDFELELSFRAGQDTESGVMLNSPKEVANPGSECYEVNIAPTSSAYPTGSLNGRLRTNDPADSPDWRKMRVKVESGKVTVWIDGKEVVSYADRRPLGSGHIGLQFTRGRVEFRGIRVQKLDLP